MHLVVCYDVVLDNRRNRLFKQLKGYLRPVQKSVFEGQLPARHYPDLVRMIERTIDRQTDTVRIYHLCRACQGLTTLIGTAAPVPDGPENLII
ncbi:CRISPR-associated endonuclease Cas2 [Myxococcota bacterium]|nr:CRISPR-associated endonuclease Cas2 [Myxococcota bacterium]